MKQPLTDMSKAGTVKELVMSSLQLVIKTISSYIVLLVEIIILVYCYLISEAG